MGALKWGLKVVVHNCTRLPTLVIIFRDEKNPFTKGPEGPQMCTIADDCARVAESGLKPHLRAPIWSFPHSVPNANPSLQCEDLSNTSAYTSFEVGFGGGVDMTLRGSNLGSGSSAHGVRASCWLQSKTCSAISAEREA